MPTKQDIYVFVIPERRHAHETGFYVFIIPETRHAHETGYSVFIIRGHDAFLE
jgi:hypothetical protein